MQLAARGYAVSYVLHPVGSLGSRNNQETIQTHSPSPV